MNYGAEPADQVVRYSLEGMEYSLKITGNVAKHVAIFIAAALKDQKKTRGKTRLTRMLKEQRPMKFFTVPGDRLKEFKNIDRMFLYKNFFFFITNEKKIFIFKTTDMESDELIKIIKTTGILFEKKEKPFNIYKYCKKGKSF